jgi:hypothetical protein
MDLARADDSGFARGEIIALIVGRSVENSAALPRPRACSVISAGAPRRPAAGEQVQFQRRPAEGQRDSDLRVRCQVKLLRRNSGRNSLCLAMAEILQVPARRFSKAASEIKVLIASS